MLKKIKPYLAAVLVLSSFVIIYIGTSRAANQEIICSEEGCSSLTGSLFNEKNLAPKDSVKKTVLAVNNYAQDRIFAVEVTNFSDSTPSLSEVLKITISKEDGEKVYGPEKISQWEQGGFITLSEISAGDQEEYSFVVTLDNVGNDYQDKTFTFDLSLGFDSLPLAVETAPTVLGVLTLEEDVPLVAEDIRVDEIRDGEIKGVICDEQDYLWWLPLLVQVVITVPTLWWSNKKKWKRWWLIPLVLALASQIVHYILGCNCATSDWCPRYWLINLAILVTSLAGYHLVRRRLIKK